MKLVEWLAFATATAGARNGFRWLHLEECARFFSPANNNATGKQAGSVSSLCHAEEPILMAFMWKFLFSFANVRLSSGHCWACCYKGSTQRIKLALTYFRMVFVRLRNYHASGGSSKLKLSSYTKCRDAVGNHDIILL